jgi:hypothetical protein
VVAAESEPLKHKWALCDIAPGYGLAWLVVRSVALGLSLRKKKRTTKTDIWCALFNN